MKLESIVDEVNRRLGELEFPPNVRDASVHLLKAGGKRMRPVMLVLCAEICGGKMDDVMPAALAVELIHNFTLVHDDIMDGSMMRRGIETVHVKYGVPMAILAGDSLFSKAFEMVAECRAAESAKLECIKILSSACMEICEGQAMDLLFEGRDNVTQHDYVEMASKKTGSLWEASARIGAVLCGGDQEPLGRFGRKVGIGFQIYDDVLGIVGNEKVIGKNKNDLIRGKKTLPVIHAISKGYSIRDLISDARIMEECVEYATNVARMWVEEGKKELEKFEDGEAKKLLMQLADYAVSRRF